MNELTEILRAEIEARGPIPFARFMELALYHPEHGYYEQAERPIGRKGDFYTSVSVGGLFGQLLAFQMAAWLDELSSTGSQLGDSPRLQLVEAGAHHGQLAFDILTWHRTHRTDLLERMEYWLLEPSTRRVEIQRLRLKEFAKTVRWFSSWEELPSAVAGVIFSNELLDAFPVHRLGWDAEKRGWFEWGVQWQGGEFRWTKLPQVSELLGDTDEYRTLADLPGPLRAVLPDGYTVEIAPQARAWWSQAARALARGKLLTIDYGFTAEEWLSPHRAAGTLRAYRGHQLAANPLVDPGQQDLTAHVSFAGLQQTGEQAGLATEMLVSQEQSLARIAQRALEPGSTFGAWSPEQRRQLQTLIHPDHLGRAFKVLVQSR